MKMKKLTAVLTAAMTVCAAMPVFSASAGGFYVEGWGPQSAEEAVEFLNAKGETRVTSDTIYIVKAIGQDMEVLTELSGTIEGAEIIHEGYEKYEPIKEEPKMPEEQTDDAMHHYYEALKEYEEYKRIVEFYGEEVFAQASQYYVLVIKPGESGDLKVTLSPKHKAEKEGVLAQDPMPSVYTFRKENNLLYETDIRDWLPDCYGEFEHYQQCDGAISVHEGSDGKESDKIVLCTSSNSSTGARLFVGQTGAECQAVQTNTQQVKRYEVLPIMKAGEPSYRLNVFEPTEEGRVEFTVCEGFTFGPGPMEITRKAYEVKKDGERFTLTEVKIAPHDLNGDGSTSIADMILLSKHLTGDLTEEEKLTATQWILADLNGDKCVDAKDLTLMQQFVIQNAFQPDPPLIHDPEPIDIDPVLPYDPTDPIVIDDPIEKPVEQ